MDKTKATPFSRMLSRKPIDSLARGVSEDGLRQSLGRSHLLMIGVGCIVGAGIFVRTGNAAAAHAGPAVILSFLIAFAVCVLSAFCYAELTAALPASGSAYTYSHISLGHFAAWIVGSLLVLEYGLAAAAVAMGWSGYVVSLLRDFGIAFPPKLAAPTGQIITFANGTHGVAICNLPAMFVASSLAVLLILGVEESARANNVMVFVKCGVVLLFIIIGGLAIGTNLQKFTPNWSPFLPPNTGRYGEFGWTGVLRGASVVIFAYLGFEAIATAGLEAKNPERDMPVALLGSLVICTLLYVLVAVVLTLSTPFSVLDVSDPLAVAIDHLGPSWVGLALIIKTGAAVGLASVVLVLMYGQTRIFYAMSNDGFLPRFFSNIHSRFRTPWKNTAVVGGITTVSAGSLDINLLGDLTSVGTLTAFAVVAYSVIRLRQVAPDMARPFRVPFYPWVPVAAVVSSLGLVLSVGVTSLKFFAIYLASSVALYLIMGSAMRAPDRQKE
jgi:APA family basic amino acid/polyamine antiporter